MYKLRHLKLKIKTIYNLSFRVNDGKLLEKHKTVGLRLKTYKQIWIKCFSSLWLWYVKTKIRTYCDKVYINFHDFNLEEGDLGCESFTVISIDSLLVYKSKYDLQVYLDNCVYSIANKQMTDLMTIFWNWLR